MRKLHENIRSLILSVVDFFYPFFRSLMPLQTFRYAACGGFNTVLDISLFFVSYNFILEKQPVHLGFLTIGPHIAAFLIGFMVTFPIGFYLSRYVVFQETSVRKAKQLAKYFTVVFGLFVTQLCLSKIVCRPLWLVSYTQQNLDHRFCSGLLLCESKEFYFPATTGELSKWLLGLICNCNVASPVFSA
jgi:putative flippase GtrA